MFIPSTFKRPVSSWKALNLRKTLLMASSVRLKPLNCSRLPCVYAQETLTFLLTQKKTCVKNYVHSINTILHELNPLFTINVTMRDIKSKNVYSRVNSKATTQWRKTESANGVHLEGVASDNRSS